MKKKTGETERERKQRESLNGPATPLVPSAAVQTRLWMTKTSSSAAGVSLRVCPRQTGTLQQEEMRGVEGLRERKKGKKEKREVFAGGKDKGAQHAEARARSIAALFMLILSQVLIVTTVHHSQLPAWPKQ